MTPAQAKQSALEAKIEATRTASSVSMRSMAAEQEAIRMRALAQQASALGSSGDEEGVREELHRKLEETTAKWTKSEGERAALKCELADKENDILGLQEQLSHLSSASGTNHANSLSEQRELEMIALADNQKREVSRLQAESERLQQTLEVAARDAEDAKRQLGDCHARLSAAMGKLEGDKRSLTAHEARVLELVTEADLQRSAARMTKERLQATEERLEDTKREHERCLTEAVAQAREAAVAEATQCKRLVAEMATQLQGTLDAMGSVSSSHASDEQSFRMRWAPLSCAACPIRSPPPRPCTAPHSHSSSHYPLTTHDHLRAQCRYAVEMATLTAELSEMEVLVASSTIALQNTQTQHASEVAELLAKGEDGDATLQAQVQRASVELSSLLADLEVGLLRRQRSPKSIGDGKGSAAVLLGTVGQLRERVDELQSARQAEWVRCKRELELTRRAAGLPCDESPDNLALSAGASVGMGGSSGGGGMGSISELLVSFRHAQEAYTQGRAAAQEAELEELRRKWTMYSGQGGSGLAGEEVARLELQLTIVLETLEGERAAHAAVASRLEAEKATLAARVAPLVGELKTVEVTEAILSRSLGSCLGELARLEKALKHQTATAADKRSQLIGSALTSLRQLRQAYVAAMSKGHNEAGMRESLDEILLRKKLVIPGPPGAASAALATKEINHDQPLTPGRDASQPRGPFADLDLTPSAASIHADATPKPSPRHAKPLKWYVVPTILPMKLPTGVVSQGVTLQDPTISQNSVITGVRDASWSEALPHLAIVPALTASGDPSPIGQRRMRPTASPFKGISAPHALLSPSPPLAPKPSCQSAAEPTGGCTMRPVQRASPRAEHGAEHGGRIRMASDMPPTSSETQGERSRPHPWHA